jgi:hypothetical protein
LRPPERPLGPMHELTRLLLRGFGEPVSPGTVQR